VTAPHDGLLPFVYDQAVGTNGALLGHVARNNAQWETPILGDALVIIAGPDAYISPSAYASKGEHGRVVPTWNYVTAHVHGHLTVHDDPGWLDQQVRRLTAMHENECAAPWSVDAAPPKFAAGQLRTIVGVEIVINRIGASEAQPEPPGGRHRRRGRRPGGPRRATATAATNSSSNRELKSQQNPPIVLSGGTARTAKPPIGSPV
jgi:transcriptional regulator